MTIEAQSADGAIHEFPDGTPDAVIDRVMKDYSRSSAQPAQQEQPREWYEDIGHAAHRALSAGTKGLNDVVGGAADYLINLPHGGVTPSGRVLQAPGQEEYVHPVRDFLNHHTVQDMGPPQNPGEQLIDATGRMVGESAPMAGITGLAAKAGMLGNFGRRVFESAAQNPLKALAGETIASGESGLVGEAARQSAEENHPDSPAWQRTAETTGQILGPHAIQMMPTALGLRLAVPAARAAIGPLRSAAGTVAEALPESYRPDWLTGFANRSARERAAGANSTVNSEIGQALAKPESQANLAEAQQLEHEIPGFRPGLARATNDPVLLNTQEKLNREATGADLRGAQEAHEANAQALRDKLAGIAPAGGPTVEAPPGTKYLGKNSDGASVFEREDGRRIAVTKDGWRHFETPDLLRGVPVEEGGRGVGEYTRPKAFEVVSGSNGENPQDLVQQAVRSRVEGLQDDLAHQQAMQHEQIQNASDALPDLERADQGARLREMLGNAKGESTAEVRRLKGEIPTRNTVPTQDFSSAVKGRLKEQGTSLTGLGPPPKLKTLINRTAERPDKVIPETGIEGVSEPQVVPQQVKPARTTKSSIKSLMDVDTELKQELRNLTSATVRTPEQNARIKALMATRDELKNFLGKQNVPGLPEFLNYYRDTHAPNFLREGSKEVLRTAPEGGFRLPDEKVMAQFGGPNNISAARQFTRVFGNNPEAVQLMVDHQLGRLKAEGIDTTTGTLREGAVDRFLTKNRELLDALPPAVRQGVAARDVNDLYGRLGQLEQRQRAVAASAVAQKLGQSPERMIDAAMNDWQIMKSLKRSVAGNPAHEAALTRSIMERAPDPADATKFSQWLQGHDRVLKQVLTPQHLADLNRIARASEIHNRVGAPQGAVELPKSIVGALGDKTGVTVPSAVGSGLSIARGRTSPLTEIPMQMVKLWNANKKNAVNAAWREALSNPDLARTVSNVMGSKQASPMQISKMYSYLVTAGLLHPHAEQQ